MRRFLTLTVMIAGCSSPPDTGEVMAFYRRGEELLRERRYENAIALLTRAANSDPTFSQAYHLRAVAYGALKKETEALADYTRAIETAPENYKADLLFARGRHLHDRKQLDRAETDYTEALRWAQQWPTPHLLPLRIQRAKLFLDLDRRSEAIREYELALALNPDAETRREIERKLMEARH